MKLRKVHLRNFRRLEDVEIGFEEDETVFVGSNNSGKTSATTAFRLFLKSPDFKIHDFSVSKIKNINAFGLTEDIEEESLPAIEMDIWFIVNPDMEYGRIISLLPNLSGDFDEAGIRLKYCVKDAIKLKTEYESLFLKEGQNQGEQKTLSHFLSLEGNLNRHFSLNYFALEDNDGVVTKNSLESEEGKRVLKSLIRVDFVDAQRNIDDREVSRSNRLSMAFSAFYKKNLEQAQVMEEANKVIDENNENLNKHYEEHFKNLMGVIQGLGVPSVNDRSMRIVSTLSPEVALQGNTDLLYVDPNLNHELPEAYNGLGFKNLVYIAIQISHFHLQWINMEEKRPLCQVIFIEEPEVHLHAQVQQTFISNIWNIVKKASTEAGEVHMIPQLGITTHSSHILDAVEFEKVRYFKRCLLKEEVLGNTKTLNASNVLNLQNFIPQKESAGGEVENKTETLKFLKKYLRLTHCDLFFSDAAILVEGTVEKLLLPEMIKRSAPQLSRNYLTILEVGGAYANRFASLMEFLGLPYLVITDIDSVDPENSRKVCRADKDNAVTSNAAIKFFYNIDSVADLFQMGKDKQKLADDSCFVTFQKPSIVNGYDQPMAGRTFEETFIYENISLFRNQTIDVGKTLPEIRDFEEEYKTVFETVKSSSFKKTEFALSVGASESGWVVPEYIATGLKWLQKKLSPSPTGGGE